MFWRRWRLLLKYIVTLRHLLITEYLGGSEGKDSASVSSSMAKIIGIVYYLSTSDTPWCCVMLSPSAMIRLSTESVYSNRILESNHTVLNFLCTIILVIKLQSHLLPSDTWSTAQPFDVSFGMRMKNTVSVSAVLVSLTARYAAEW